MKLKQLAAAFERFSDEYIQFENVENKLSKRPDMHAFMLLDKLIPGDGKFDMVTCAEHGQIWLGIEPEALARVASEQTVLDLVRCGVSYDDETESLYLFA